MLSSCPRRAASNWGTASNRRRRACRAIPGGGQPLGDLLVGKGITGGDLSRWGSGGQSACEIPAGGPGAVERLLRRRTFILKVVWLQLLQPRPQGSASTGHVARAESRHAGIEKFFGLLFPQFDD